MSWVEATGVWIAVVRGSACPMSWEMTGWGTLRKAKATP